MKFLSSFYSPTRTLIIVLLGLLLSSCTGVPSGIKPVEDFQLQRYLGTWYEIARLDHRFERGYTNVSAQYSMSGDGSVKVINRGYSEKENEWKTAQGKAKLVKSDDIGYLKVSFFGPFYGSYVIFKLDEQDYSYAFVTSHNRDYLWLLSRTPNVSEELLAEFREFALDREFDLSELIIVEHNNLENSDI